MGSELGVEVDFPAAVAAWVSRYKAQHREQASQDPEFAEWLETSYVPIAGGWHY